jgi:hypothetical protein
MQHALCIYSVSPDAPVGLPALITQQLKGFCTNGPSCWKASRDHSPADTLTAVPYPPDPPNFKLITTVKTPACGYLKVLHF